jgi:hypothetical protein
VIPGKAAGCGRESTEILELSIDMRKEKATHKQVRVQFNLKERIPCSGAFINWQAKLKRF